MKQLDLLEKQKKAYGGELLKTRKGRAHGRPLSTRATMHLVLRSSQAKGKWSFRDPENEMKIRRIIAKFSEKYAVRVLSLGNVGNHLHFHLKLANRFTYAPFIRAITAAIAMAVTKASRWKPRRKGKKFWDYRPFSRVVETLRGFLNLRDYVRINQLEGFGADREEARYIISRQSRLVSIFESG